MHIIFSKLHPMTYIYILILIIYISQGVSRYSVNQNLHILWANYAEWSVIQLKIDLWASLFSIFIGSSLNKILWQKGYRQMQLHLKRVSQRWTEAIRNSQHTVNIKYCAYHYFSQMVSWKSIHNQSTIDICQKSVVLFIQQIIHRYKDVMIMFLDREGS